MAKKSTAKAKSAATPSAPKNYISLAPLRRLMKAEGAVLVSEDALQLMKESLVKAAIDIVKKATKFAEDDKRKRLSKEDILVAVK